MFMYTKIEEYAKKAELPWISDILDRSVIARLSCDSRLLMDQLTIIGLLFFHLLGRILYLVFTFQEKSHIKYTYWQSFLFR